MVKLGLKLHNWEARNSLQFTISYKIESSDLERIPTQIKP